jgi:hypothetical protein
MPYRGDSRYLAGLPDPGRGAGVTEQAGVGEIEVSAGGFDDLEAFYAELRGVPGIVVTPVPAPVVRGDQGALVDVLMVACTSGAITALLQIVNTLLESRGPGFRLKIRRGKDRLEITADDAEEGLAALKELLDGP